MSDIQTILTGIDVHRTTGRIIETAAQLARPFDGTRQFLCHAVDPISPVYEQILFPYACFGDDREAVITDLLTRAEDIMNTHYKANCESLGRHTLKMTYGGPTEALLREAQQLGPDIIVIGADTSNSPPQRLGSNAAKLAARAPVPVLVVRRQSGSVVFKKFGVALDFSADSTACLARGVSYAHQFDAEINAIHVIPTAEHLDHGGYVEQYMPSVDDDLIASVDQRFQQTAANMKLSFPIRKDIEERLKTPEIRQGEPGSKIVEFTEQMNLDMLVLNKSRSTGGSGLQLGRVTEYVLRHANCDVLLLPPIADSQV